MNEEEQPLITILITVGENDTEFDRTFTSCIEQSYKPVEVLVVDYGDGSRRSLVDSETYPDIRFIDASDAGGVSAARNRALEQAQGEYVLFVESGQQVQAMWLGKAVDRFKLSQADAVQCATVYEQDNRTARVHMPNDSLFGFYQRLLYEPSVPLNSMIVRKEICSRFPEEMNRAGDWEFWISTLKGRKVDVLPEYYGSIIMLSQQVEKEQDPGYLREKYEIMREHYPELRRSIRKVKQFFRLRKGT
jgi:glycosyltransferase involved in cell wall biosynthesis